MRHLKRSQRKEIIICLADGDWLLTQVVKLKKEFDFYKQQAMNFENGEQNKNP